MSPFAQEFWITPSGAIYDKYFYDGKGWSEFELAPAGSAISGKSGITALSRIPGAMEVS